MNNNQGQSPLLSVRDLTVSFNNGKGPRLRAVDGASLTVFPGQTVAVVGESGCGKSVTAMSILRLVPTPPGKYDTGTIRFQRQNETIDLLAVNEADVRSVRGKDIAMIFQEPMSSLNPVFSIGDQIIEAIRLHHRTTRKEAKDIAIEALRDVGIIEPTQSLRAYPHEYSGGMRQRAMIAMALACKPELLIADEPTTALDVTIQAQILELLKDIQKKRAMAILLITHDLGIVAEHADVVFVMYAGRIVECARVNEIFDTPLHPYTRGLLSSIPRISTKTERLRTIDELMRDTSAFASIGPSDANLRPWWPWHDTPKDISPKDPPAPATDSELIQTSSDHWVAVWRTHAAGALTHTPPSISTSKTPTGAGV